MLQVSAEADGLQSSPEEVLVHSVRVVSPGLELISESGEFLLKSLDVRRVLVEEDSTGSSLEALQLRQGLVLEDLLGDSTGLDQRGESLGGQIPQAIVLLVQ